MDKPPQWLLNLLPVSLRGYLDGVGWYVALGAAALIVLLFLLVLLAILRKLLFGGKAQPRTTSEPAEVLADYPPLTTPPGPERLLCDGVKVRVRLVVLAPTGNNAEINAAMSIRLLDKVVPGLGAIAKNDKARICIWPAQLSYQGFNSTFHRNTPKPEDDGEPSHWVLVSGRAKVGQQQVMVGLGLFADKKTTLGRKNLQPHQWNESLAIKERG